MRITQRRHDYIPCFLRRPLVIVHNFNIPRIVIDPSKADAPLIIYPNAHLTSSFAPKDLQLISGWISQVLQDCRGI